MAGEEKVRITRGNHLRTAVQSLRLFTMVLAAAAATLSLHKTLTPTAAAEADIDPVMEEQTELEPLTFTAGTPASTTPSDVKPTDAILKWTATGTGTQEDTYDVRLAASNEVDIDTGELTTPVHSENGLTVPQYDATALALAEGAYYWQVRSCGLITCNDWSPVWSLIVDGTAPAEPTAAVTSDAYDQTVILAGSAEAGSTVHVTVGDLNCTTMTLEDGTWNCQFSDEFEFGDYAALIKTTDKAGNESTVLMLEFAVKELFVAPQITAEELPIALEIVPVDETPENKVFKQPVTSVIDVVNTGNTDELNQPKATVAPLSTDGGIVQSSENGWQVLGLPWFIWLGSMAGITGGWWAFGAPVPRRLGSLLSL